MENLYYIMEGENPKGPFLVKEIKDFNLNAETLVWKEGMESPAKLEAVSELASADSSAPVRPLKSKPRRMRAAIRTFFTVATISVLSIAIIYIVSAVISNRKEKQKTEINKQINELFDGKTAIIDGQKTDVTGEFIETGYTGRRNKNGIIKTVANGPKEEWWEEAQLYTVYKCLEGGFTLKKLARTEDNRFEVDIYESSDMGYTNPGYSFTNPEFLAWMKLFSEGSKTGHFRTGVQNCYDFTFDLLAEKSKSDAFTPGKLSDIENFSKISNKYYFIKNLGPKVITPAGNATYRQSASGEVITNVSADDYTVYYSTTGFRYELAENEAMLKQDIRQMNIYGLGGFYLLIAISVISKYLFFRK
ncbi:MAG TPA: DUF4339 domain-containing protein [Bacteroidia bacterium]|nr:DUF4339 domain-containing protein [Bacteroidia bacterium]